jgi:hypothetical protein
MNLTKNEKNNSNEKKYEKKSSIMKEFFGF